MFKIWADGFSAEPTTVTKAVRWAQSMVMKVTSAEILARAEDI
jgi:hypothetical protein